MQRPFQSRASGCDRRVNSSQSRSRHARRESRGVELVIRVENENRVEHPDLPILRNPAVQLIEKVSCVREVRFFGQWLVTMRDSPAVRDQGRHARDQPNRLANVRRVRVIAQFLVEGA